jgi:hypothetical protein
MVTTGSSEMNLGSRRVVTKTVRISMLLSPAKRLPPNSVFLDADLIDFPCLAIEVGGAVRPRLELTDRVLLRQAHALLQFDSAFQNLQDPIIARVEVYRARPSHQPGHMYLRYELPDDLSEEFWPHWGKENHVCWQWGQVSVRT